MVDVTSTIRKRAKWLERVRHVAWAGVIALVLYMLTLLQPVDQVGWAIQSRMGSHQASGDVVFIGSEADLSEPELPQGRRHLAETIARLDAAGAERVYIDYVFDRDSNPVADRELGRALRAFSGEIYLVRPVERGLNREETMRQNTPTIGTGIENVASHNAVNFLGYVWDMPYAVEVEGEQLANLPAHIAGVDRSPQENFPVDYTVEISTFPSFRFADVMRDPASLGDLTGKTIVIGSSAAKDQGRIPGHLGVPNAQISIFGAETLKSGNVTYLNGLLALLVMFAGLLIASILSEPRFRYFCYLLLVLAVPVAVLATASLSVRMSGADALALLFFYSLFRARASWTQKLRLVDPDTGLPTFAALEADTDVAEALPAIIVAKIHRFEEVRRTLPTEMHADYTLAIANRLRAATQDATIYLGLGHQIAWTMEQKDPGLLREHLEGLRALFSSPLVVGKEQVDVGITFGIDVSPSPNVARRLAAAVAVAEQTTETFEPIAVADSTSQEDLIWSISLQARIDAALANGEIYLVYQPKIMVQTGEIVGAEALVRWKDPVKGHIPPDNFIKQCETAGRMSQLTRFVLEEACKAGNAFAAEGLNLPLSVNISATLLHERSIVKMVSEVLEETGFEPRRLTLEITETFRISNLNLAAEILGELHALGTKISMDDFGVGAASLEALLRLPFSELKIDRMFIAPMRKDEKALGIVKSILQLGKDLRIIIVAEGVEDAGTLTLLRDSGCLVAQGFAISRPVSFDKILGFHKDSKNQTLRNIV